MLILCISGHVRHDIQNCDTILHVRCVDGTDERQRLFNKSTIKMQRENVFYSELSNKVGTITDLFDKVPYRRTILLSVERKELY